MSPNEKQELMKLLKQRAVTTLTENNVVAELGELKFPESKMTDAHIKKIVKQIAVFTKVPESEIISDIEKQVKLTEGFAKVAPNIYGTLVSNVIESVVKQLLAGHEVKGAPTFTTLMFNRLLSRIKIEHKSMFHMSNIVNRKIMEVIDIKFVPDSRYNKSYNSVTTAACFNDGTFVFNTKFMQDCLNFAHLKGIKPKSKKYKNNGGDFDPEWCYIEFLILHEFHHYTKADFHYYDVLQKAGKHGKIDPYAINIVGDLRTNYDLHKEGVEILPGSFYSDFINYDRQTSYSDMLTIVQKELKALSEEQKKELEKQMDQHGEHPDSGDSDGDSEDGDGDGQDSDNSEDQDWDPKIGMPVNLPDGKFGKITDIAADGNISVEEITKEEADQLAGGSK